MLIALLLALAVRALTAPVSPAPAAETEDEPEIVLSTPTVVGFSAPLAAAVPPPTRNAALAKKAADWELTLSFGPGRTQYFPTDVKVKSSNMDVVFEQAAVRERHSMEYYDFTKNPQPLRAIDEPTNTFTLRATNNKKKTAVYLHVFHPKFLLVAPGLNEYVTARGVIDAQPVNGPRNINEIFGKYQLTYGLVNVALGAEKIFTLVEGKGGKVDYAPGVAPSVFIGSSDAVMRDPGAPNTFKEYRQQKLKPIGMGMSMSNRVTYTIPGGRANVSLTHTLTGSRLRYDILDGHAEQSLNYQTVNVSAGVRLYKSKKRRPSNLLK